MPTPAPTATPTQSPTIIPTPAPTAMPTSALAMLHCGGSTTSRLFDPQCKCVLVQFVTVVTTEVVPLPLPSFADAVNIQPIATVDRTAWSSPMSTRLTEEICAECSSICSDLGMSIEASPPPCLRNPSVRSFAMTPRTRSTLRKLGSSSAIRDGAVSAHNELVTAVTITCAVISNTAHGDGEAVANHSAIPGLDCAYRGVPMIYTKGHTADCCVMPSNSALGGAVSSAEDDSSVMMGYAVSTDWGRAVSSAENLTAIAIDDTIISNFEYMGGRTVDHSAVTACTSNSASSGGTVVAASDFTATTINCTMASTNAKCCTRCAEGDCAVTATDPHTLTAISVYWGSTSAIIGRIRDRPTFSIDVELFTCDILINIDLYDAAPPFFFACYLQSGCCR